MKEIFINVDSFNSDSIGTIQNNNNCDSYKIYILKNKRRLDITNKTVRMCYVRTGTKDRDIIDLEITNAKEGEVTLPVTNRITAKDGVYCCQLAIYGENNFLEHTTKFTLTVESNIFAEIAEEIANRSDFSYLENILYKSEKLSEKLKENTSSATNANSNLESNITEANNINSKLLENTSTATGLNKNLESNIDLAKEVKETIKDLDTKNIEATEKIETLTGLNAKATELSDNINKGLPLNSELVRNTEEAKTANNELIATNNDAKAKKTDLDNSLEEAKKYISGLDGSQNIPQIRMDVTELQNGLKSNQALAYKGSSISAENTLEGRTEGMRIGGRTLVNISPKGISDCSSISAFNHNYQEVKVEQGDGFVKCTQPLAKKYNILGYDNVNMLKTNTYYLHMAYVEILNNPSNDTCEFQLGNFDTFKTIKISQGKGIVAALTKTHSNLSGGNSKWISLMLGGLNSTGENRSFKVFNIATYEISEKEASLEIESLIKLYPIKCNGMKSFGESEREGDKYKISILSSGKNLFDGELEIGSILSTGENDNNTTRIRTKNYIDTKNLSQIFISSSVSGTLGIRFYGYSKKCLGATTLIVGNTSNRLDLRENTRYIRFSHVDNTDLNSKYMISETAINIDKFEPYKCDKKDILIKEPLREGDYLYEGNGQVKVYRDVKQYTFTGDENISIRGEVKENTMSFAYKVKNNKSNALLCNNFKVLGGWDKDEERIWLDGTNLMFHIQKSKLTTPDVNGFKAWLKANPTTIVYQLATSTVEIVENCVDIDLDTFGEKTYFNILNSLPGTLDFKVPSNITSIVQANSKAINELYNLIDTLVLPNILQNTTDIEMLKLEKLK